MAQSRGATTIRLPVDRVDRAERVKVVDESFNDLVVDAIEREVRRRQGLHAFAAIQETRDQVETRTGPQPDSVPLIRALRDEGRLG